MDDDENYEDEIEYAHARRHDKWSVVVLTLNLGVNVLSAGAEYLAKLTVAASQHANQLTYDKKFDELTKEF